MQKIQEIHNLFLSKGLKAETNKKLAQFTTFKIGGPADLFVSVKDWQQLELVISKSVYYQTPYIVIGKGSNLLISEKGFRGIVIQNNANNWQILDKKIDEKKSRVIKSRFNVPTLLDSPSFEEDNSNSVLVRVESGTVLAPFIKALLKEGISGLEWFAGIPATVGGAIFMNLHGTDFYFGNLIESAFVTDGHQSKLVNQDYFKFNYDYSVLHQTKEIVLYADLRLNKGKVDIAKKTIKEWARYKANQPQRSAGCIFKNLDEKQQQKIQSPTPGTGYVIDKLLGLKGYRKGDAIISENHAAFIENLGNAKATDVNFLIALIRQKAQSQLGLNLELEIEMIGEF